MSERRGGVEVAFGSIQRRLAELGHDEVDLLLARSALERRPIKKAVALASEAVERANAAVAPGTVAAGDVRPSRRGPVIHLDQIDTRHEVDKWLTAFASFVESAGWSGVLGPAGTVSKPRWFHAAHGVPKLTAYVGYEVSDPLAYGDVAVGRSMSWASTRPRPQPFVTERAVGPRVPTPRVISTRAAPPCVVTSPTSHEC